MKIALIGRFEEGEILAGPERVGRELFFELKKINSKIVFIEYFFSGYSDSSSYKKLFGKEFIKNNSIIKLGLFPLLLFLVKEQFEIIHIVNLQRFILILFFLKPLLEARLQQLCMDICDMKFPVKIFWSKDISLIYGWKN